jgi:phage terminase Nu1 subunit (DNA packaging protein)
MNQQGAEVIDFAAAKRRREQSSEPWVKKERVAEHFDVSTRTVYRWVEAGCPIKRLRGGTLRFQIGVISDWLEQQSR